MIKEKSLTIQRRLVFNSIKASVAHLSKIVAVTGCTEREVDRALQWWRRRGMLEFHSKYGWSKVKNPPPPRSGLSFKKTKIS
jgi:hypothetical protein